MSSSKRLQKVRLLDIMYRSTQNVQQLTKDTNVPGGGRNACWELYHNINSVCAQKVRVALKEKGQEAKEHILTLRGDQNEPEYLKLNPNGVVPTLVHDGQPIVEVVADPLLHRRGVSRSAADADGASTAASRAHVQQADR